MPAGVRTDVCISFSEPRVAPFHGRTQTEHQSILTLKIDSFSLSKVDNG